MLPGFVRSRSRAGWMTPKTLLSVARDAAVKWNHYDAPRLGAALAFYTLLSVAPLTIVMVAICGLAFGKTRAERDLLNQIQRLTGLAEAKTLKLLLENAHHRGSGIVASITAVITLFLGASGMFVELRNSLNLIWGAPPVSSSVWRLVTERLTSFGMVLALGLLLLLSVLISTFFTLLERFFSEIVPLRAAIGGEVANIVLTLVGTAFLFALIFRYIPDVKIASRDVVIGAIITAILFSLGKALLAFYLATAAVASTYGAAGSVIAFVVWVYYSAQIFLYGAVFTRVYADTVGSHARRLPQRK
jgi:membrane protein